MEPCKPRTDRMLREEWSIIEGPNVDFALQRSLVTNWVVSVNVRFK